MEKYNYNNKKKELPYFIQHLLLFLVIIAVVGVVAGIKWLFNF